MKHLLGFYLCCLPFFAFTQSSGDIQKDTALANQYYQEALRLHEIEEDTSTSTKMNVLLEKGITLYEAHPFDEKTLALKGLLANKLYFQNKLEGAIELGEATLNLVKREWPNQKYIPELWNAYHTLMLSLNNNDKLKAIEYGEKGMKCVNKNSEKYLKTGITLVTIYLTAGNPNKATLLLNELETILNEVTTEKITQHWVGFYQCKLRHVSMTTRNHEQALIYGEKALAENEKHQTYTPIALSKLYMDIGQMYSYIRDFDKSIDYLKKGIETFPFKDNRPELGGFYFVLGQAYLIKRDNELAAKTLDKALNYYQLDSANYTIQLSVSYLNKSIAFFRLAQYDEAEIAVRKSLSFNNSSNDQVFTYYQLSLILKQKKEYETALHELQKAIIFISTNFKDADINKNPSEFEQYKQKLAAHLTLTEKGINWCEWGYAEKDTLKIQKGLECLAHSIRYHEWTLKQATGFDKSSYRINELYTDVINAKLKAHYYWYEIAPSRAILNKILQITEKKKAVHLIGTLSPSTLPENIIEKEKGIIETMQFNGQKLDLATTHQQKDSIKHYQNALFEANEEMEKHLKEIKESHPKTVAEFYNNDYVNIDELQEMLPENTLLISYTDFSFEEKYGGMILAVGSETHRIAKTDILGLKNNIEKLYELTQNPFSFQKTIREEFIDLSHRLYKMLIQPIETALEGKTKLMIVLEGELFHLPFELLLKSDEKKAYKDLDFLLKKYEINYHYSATAFLKLKEKPTPSDNSFLGFAPVFEYSSRFSESTRSLDFMTDSIYRSINKDGFVALLNTQKEIETIASLLKKHSETPIKTFIQKEATKTNLVQHLDNQPYQFIHIATHGLVNYKNPKLSALACHSENEESEELLYANEIQFKNINADLVVLSSCESGIGQLVVGEGLIALNRSFIYAGAKNVLFSLWKVSDKYSSQLMIEFYKNYLKGQSYTTALRNAKLKMLETPASALPKHWGAFVLMGE